MASTFTYNDFSSVAGLTLVGDAAQAGSVLRLVPAVQTQAGDAYRTSAIPIDDATGFSTAFEFHITTDPGDPTDGFSFILQNQAVNALGGSGQGNGYTGIAPSVAVVFRGRNPTFIGVVANGIDPLPGIPPDSATPAEGSFYNQDEFAWIDYDPFSTTLSVFLNTTSAKPVSPVMSTAVNLFAIDGAQAFVGFGAGNGGAFGDQDILSWTFTSQEMPEPAAGLLVMLGLGAVTALRRRRA